MLRSIGSRGLFCIGFMGLYWAMDDYLNTCCVIPFFEHQQLTRC